MPQLGAGLSSPNRGTLGTKMPSEHSSSSAPPRTGVALEWRDLAFSVPMKAAKAGDATTKRILSGMSGRALPGTLTLLMGPSGAG